MYNHARYILGFNFLCIYHVKCIIIFMTVTFKSVNSTRGMKYLEPTLINKLKRNLQFLEKK